MVYNDRTRSEPWGLLSVKNQRKEWGISMDKEKKSKEFLIAVLIAVVASFAVILVISKLVDRNHDRMEEEKKNKKIEDLTVKSLDGKVTLSFSQCVYEGDAMKSGELVEGYQYKNASCDSAESFYANVIAASPNFYGVFQREGVFVTAAEITTSSTGGGLFFKDNHCFDMSFGDTSKVNYEKYFVELGELCMCVKLPDGVKAYLPFPVDGHHRRDLSAWETTAVNYGEMIGPNRFVNMVQFYGGMDASHCFIDEEGETIYAKLSCTGDHTTDYVAKIVSMENGVAISFGTTAEVQAKFENAFAGK